MSDSTKPFSESKPKAKRKKWISLLDEELNKEKISSYNISVLKAVNKHIESSGGYLWLVDRPIFPVSNLSNSELQIDQIDWSNNRIERLQKNPPHLINGYFTELKLEYTQQVFSGPPNKLRNNYMVNEDFENNYVIVRNGYRQGVDKDYPENVKSVYLFGSSLVYSFGCQESHTLSSLLENRIDNSKYRVLNRGVRGSDTLNAAFAILDTKISNGDIVILYGLYPFCSEEKFELKKEFNYIDLKEIFARPHQYGSVFYDKSHLTPMGNKIVAGFIAREIEETDINKSFIRNISSSDKEKDIFIKLNQSRIRAAFRYIDESFPAYIEFLKSKYIEGNNGIVVVNCNPFTLGHKYLITTASKMVDNLYVFVVEEDKSYFPYKQRLEMIQEGLSDMENLQFIPTNKFVVSLMTFPDYFSKEDSFNPAMNVDYDFEIFYNYIAPVLNISKRFIGTEPYCKTTRTQHEIMKRTLPQKGISVVEVDRLENEFGPISASKVRQIIKSKDYDKVKFFLPETTRELLMKFGHYDKLVI